MPRASSATCCCDPPALLLDVLGALATRLALDVIAHDLGKRRAGPGQLLGEVVDLPVHFVADDEPLLGVEHRQPARHVVERDLEPAVELLELLLVLQNLFGVELEGGQRVRQLRRRLAGLACGAGGELRAHSTRAALDGDFTLEWPSYARRLSGSCTPNW